MLTTYRVVQCFPESPFDDSDHTPRLLRGAAMISAIGFVSILLGHGVVYYVVDSMKYLPSLYEQSRNMPE